MKQSNLARSSGGFTLIELMIVVAVVAILAAVAYPSYVSSVIKGKRAEGRAALVELMQQQERFMTQRNTYASWLDPLSTSGDAPAFKKFSGDTGTKPAYRIIASDCDDPSAGVYTAVSAKLRECVMLTATPTFTDAEAGKLELRSTGQKSCSGGSKPSVCWN